MAKHLFNIRIVFKFLGYLLLLETLLILLSGVVSIVCKDNDWNVFLHSAGITMIGSVLFSLLGLHSRKDIAKHESYVIVTSVWVFFSLFGAFPFYFSGFPSFSDAFFESVSGFSTTGASVMTDIESFSHGILFWRSLIQWLGGMGIIILSLALMPLLKLGNFQLFTAESPGPVYDKVHPRISVSARWLWFVYCGLTLAETLLLIAGNMSPFDAVCHAFTTTATGGFSTKNASIAYWDSPYIEYVITFFMFLSGTSFVLLLRILRGDFKKVKNNEEFKTYLYILLGSTIVLSGLIYFLDKTSLGTSLRMGLFQTVSIVTTTGFYTTDFSHWQPCLRIAIILLMCCGAMSGSTSGNVKIARILLYFKIFTNELKREVHPNAVLPVMYNGRALPNSVISNLFGFLFLYILLMFLSTGILFGIGVNMEEALGISLTTIGNVGPGLGNYFTSFADLPDIIKWFLGLLMIVGRLEIYTVILLFSKEFWKN